LDVKIIIKLHERYNNLLLQNKEEILSLFIKQKAHAVLVRVGQQYPKTSVQLPVAERKRFPKETASSAIESKKITARKPCITIMQFESNRTF